MARGAPDWFSSINQIEEGVRIVHLPSRLTAGSAFNQTNFGHGVVAADWALDTAPSKTQAATHNLYINSVSISVSTDSTAEVAVQEIPGRLIIADTTAGVWLTSVTFCIPSNTHFTYPSPFKVAKSHTWETRVQLGGATALNIAVYMMGFESID